jgi:hypothetical protein
MDDIKVGDYFKDSSGCYFEIAGYFKDSEDKNIYVIKLDDYIEGVPLKRLISDYGFKKQINALNLDDKYSYHYMPKQSDWTLAYDKVKDTRLARKMCKKIYKEEDGWLYVKI